jgi:hypothetical protein
MMEKEIPLSPFLSEKKKDFILFCEEVVEYLSKGVEDSSYLKSLRTRVLPKNEFSTENNRFFLAANVVLDLVAQGWEMRVTDGVVTVSPPKLKDTSSTAIAKEFIRKGHLVERDEQLSEPSVAEFVRGMERRRLTEKGWHSIYSLMRNGKELASNLKNVASLIDDKQRQTRLIEVIAPYIEFVESERKCSHTGMFLQDIWRYFRHTWVNAYKSLPGRSIQILIRDAAAPNHPVIGIAALGSSVVQQTTRDRQIGWDVERFLDNLRNSPTAIKAKWLRATLESLIVSIYRRDIEAEGILTSLDIEYPTARVIEKLKNETERAKEQHRRYPRISDYRVQILSSNGRIDWEAQARLNLFRSKRCSTLAALLSIRKIFQEAGFNVPTKRNLSNALKSKIFCESIGQLIRFKKAENVGIHMMDIIICGAIPPYNLLLGGKLVCMLLCSPEIIDHYAKRYGSQVSVIASSMKGTAVVKKPNLVFLGTTSLYGVGSSQYNRVRIPAVEIGGKSEDEVVYRELGLSEGFGSYHLSRDTIGLMDNLLSRNGNGRQVNFIFGEGVNPRMRHIRQALSIINLPSDIILKHGNKRVVYGVELAKNYREVLLGLQEKPSYILPQSKPRTRTDRLSSYWRKRWLSKRINNEEVLGKVAQHTVSYPVTHGARVRLPMSEDSDDFLLGLA